MGKKPQCQISYKKHCIHKRLVDNESWFFSDELVIQMERSQVEIAMELSLSESKCTDHLSFQKNSTNLSLFEGK